MNADERPVAGERLRAEREERGLSRLALARRLLAAIPDDDPQHPDLRTLTDYIKRWESGRVKALTLRYQNAYATALNVDRAEIFEVEPASTLEPNALVTGEDEDEVQRRQLMRNAGALSATAALAPVLTALTEAWQASQPCIPGSTVSRAMIDDWTAGYGIHVRSYAVEPPTNVLTGLSRDWSEMAPHLASSQPDEVQRDLSHAAARHAYLIAAVLSQLGNRRQAARWWATSHKLADKSGDGLLSAYTRSWEVTNRVLETPTEELTGLLELAQDARRLAGRRPTVQLIYATTVQAEVLAFMGHHDAAAALVRQAEKVFDKVPSRENSHEEMLRFDQSLVFSVAGLHREATEAQAAAQALYRPERDLYTATQVRLHGALLHARTDPGEAGRQATAILSELPPEHRVKRVILAGKQVLEAMPEDVRTLPAAHDLRELTRVGAAA